MSSQIFSNPTRFSQYFLSSFLRLTALPSTMWNYVILILTKLKCLFDILLYTSYSFPTPRLYDMPMTTSSGEPIFRITRHGHNNEGVGHAAQNCAVCLVEVEEGEEIGELRCSHVFHRLCLERWARLKHTTCPLCRGSLAPPMRNTNTNAEADLEVEVLFFKFRAFGSEDDDRDSWWLR